MTSFGCYRPECLIKYYSLRKQPLPTHPQTAQFSSFSEKEREAGRAGCTLPSWHQQGSPGPERGEVWHSLESGAGGATAR